MSSDQPPADPPPSHSDPGPRAPVQPEVIGGDKPTAAQVGYLRAPGRRWIGRLGWIAFFITLTVLMSMLGRYWDYFDTTAGLQEKFYFGSKSAPEKIAVIRVTGIIRGGDGFVKKQIDRVREDKAVKAVVLRIDSPGGTISGSDYIHHHLSQLRQERDIPIVVSMGSMAASGGYYVAMAAGDRPQTLFAEPTTTTGSIGVLIPHYDVSGLMDKLGVKDDSLATHPRKKLLSMTKPISEEDRAVLEQYLQDAFERFKQIVRAGRPNLPDEKLDEIATGEIFSANRALELGLDDRIGFVEDAADRAAELASLDPEQVRVVRYQGPLSLTDLLASTRASEPSGQWQDLLQQTAPQAFYLHAAAPPLHP